MSKKPFALGVMVLSAATLCYSKEWRGIIPLKSTRVDVERLLGRKENRSVVQYNLKDKSVMIWYSKGPCGSTPDTGWNVPRDTVTSIHIFIKKPVRLLSLALDLSKFEKVRGDADLPDHFYYVNEADGFGIEVQNLRDGRGEIVTGYLYGPTWNDGALKCKKTR